MPPAEPPPAGPEVPGSSAATNLASSPFVSTYIAPAPLSNAFSNFNVLGKQVDGRTGAVKLTVAVFHRGTLHWTLTFREASGAERGAPLALREARGHGAAAR